TCLPGDCTDNGDGTGTIRFSGSVTNCSQGSTPDRLDLLTINNVGVIDVVNGVTNVVLGPTNTLLAGGGLNFSGSYKAPCGPSTDVIYVTGVDANDVTPLPVSSSCSNTCSVACRPAIKVYKQVVCYTNLCEPFSDDLNSQKSATGVRTDNPLNCPAFCYRIIVTNAGCVPLTGLTVTDQSSPGPNLDLSGCGFPTTLAVGASFACTNRDVTRCSNDVNVVTATAQGLNSFGTNQTVSAQDTNTVTVLPINIDCGLYVRTNGGTA